MAANLRDYPYTMRLTPELIAHVHRPMEDPGPIPGVPHFGDSDYADIVDALLSQAMAGEPLRVFAYGSLIWNPEYRVERIVHGTVHGWHRAFCMRLERFRGSRDQPGLMMGLERGGSCRGIVHEVAYSDRRDVLDALVRREMITKPCTYSARWLPVRTAEGTRPAISFTINRAGRFYEGGLSLEAVAHRLAGAVGHLGTNAEYLMNTIQHLEQYGIRDRNLCALEKLVAERILAGQG